MMTGHNRCLAISIFGGCGYRLLSRAAGLPSSYRMVSRIHDYLTLRHNCFISIESQLALAVFIQVINATLVRRSSRVEMRPLAINARSAAVALAATGAYA